MYDEICLFVQVLDSYAPTCALMKLEVIVANWNQVKDHIYVYVIIK